MGSTKNSDYVGFEGSFECSERLQTAPTGSGDPMPKQLDLFLGFVIQ